MNVNQRNRILQNIDLLVNLTDFDELCQAGFRNHLLSAKMMHNIYRFQPCNSGDNGHYDEDEIKKERHKRLFIKITKRGPDAFEKLRTIFISLKYKEALNVLFNDENGMISIRSSKNAGRPTSGNEGMNQESLTDNNTHNQALISVRSDNNIDMTLHEFTGLIKPHKTVLVRKTASFIKDSKIAIYPMESKNNRGIFFMISCNEPRHQEVDEDVQSLLSLFQQLGFKLYAYSNITLNTFFQLLEELLSSDKIIDIECFVLALKTGGRLIADVQWMTFIDGSVVKVEEIQKYFYHYKCKALMGKPKIFIYPYSETPNTDVKSTRKFQTECIGRVKGSKQVAQLSDVINCYATTKGFMDDRDNDNYSRYIQHFVDVVAEHACDTHFENILKLVQHKVAKSSITGSHLQTASYDNICFNKILYFNPGV